MQSIYQTISNFFFNTYNTGLIQRIFTECHNQLAESTSSYAIIALGSFALGTATLWSDFEYAILIEKKDDIEYFRNLAYLAHIKIINMGESLLRSIGVKELNNFKLGTDDWFWDDVIEQGFSLDGKNRAACKTPLGRKNYMALPDFELILTPNQMGKLQSSMINKHLSQALMLAIFVQGDNRLVAEYKSKKKAIDSIGILLDDLNKYWLSADIINKVRVDVKRDIYRLVDRIISGLGSYYGIVGTSWHIAEQLVDVCMINGVIRALEIACELRLIAGYQNKSIDIIVVDNKVRALIIEYTNIMLVVQLDVKNICIQLNAI